MSIGHFFQRNGSHFGTLFLQYIQECKILNNTAFIRAAMVELVLILQLETTQPYIFLSHRVCVIATIYLVKRPTQVE